jgi:hypothetical protein
MPCSRSFGSKLTIHRRYTERQFFCVPYRYLQGVTVRPVPCVYYVIQPVSALAVTCIQARSQSCNHLNAPHVYSLHRPARMSARVGKVRLRPVCPHWFPQFRQRSCGPTSETDWLWHAGQRGRLRSAAKVPFLALSDSNSSHLKNPSYLEPLLIQSRACDVESH